ncbi:MAG: META domain-containing protein [Melioribacteraceae bacterium]|nr:META domain-containing protein [Melioribacteraceae bacterium]MCF8411907.1 META domain-containing protein [Melioribacteraceae bacterium]
MKINKSYLFRSLLLLVCTGLFSCASVRDYEHISSTKHMTGYFSYMADSGIFIDCQSGAQYPVASEQDYLNMEKEYLSLRTETNQKILVDIQARIGRRLPMEGNEDVDFLIVDSLGQFYIDKNCSDFISVATLINTYWKLVELDGDSIAKNFDRDVHFIVENEGTKIRGFSGCNNFFGEFELNGNSISISQPATTKKLCENISDFEDRFLFALTSSTHYEIWGETLTLFSKNTIIAKFKSIYFN